MALFGRFNDGGVKTLYIGSDESPPGLTFLHTLQGRMNSEPGFLYGKYKTLKT